MFGSAETRLGGQYSLVFVLLQEVRARGAAPVGERWGGGGEAQEGGGQRREGDDARLTSFLR